MGPSTLLAAVTLHTRLDGGLLFSQQGRQKKEWQRPVSCKWQTEGQRLCFPNLEEELQHKTSSQEEMQIWSGNTKRRTSEKKKKKGSRSFIRLIRRIASSRLTFSVGNNQKQAEDKSSVCCRQRSGSLHSESDAGCNNWLWLDGASVYCSEVNYYYLFIFFGGGGAINLQRAISCVLISPKIA